MQRLINSSLNALVDTSISSPVTSDVVSWDGSSWVNTPITTIPAIGELAKGLSSIRVETVDSTTYEVEADDKSKILFFRPTATVSVFLQSDLATGFNVSIYNSSPAASIYLQPENDVPFFGKGNVVLPLGYAVLVKEEYGWFFFGHLKRTT